MPSTTPVHRKAERALAVTTLLGNTLQIINPPLIIPKTFDQILISGAAIFNPGTFVSEKIIHVVQAGLATAQLCFSIQLLFDIGKVNNIISNRLKERFLRFFLVANSV